MKWKVALLSLFAVSFFAVCAETASAPQEDYDPFVGVFTDNS